MNETIPNEQKTSDAFLQIAQQAQVGREDLIEPLPVPLASNRIFELKPGCDAVCRPSVPCDEAWFDAELKRLRTEWAPFLANHAPPLPQTRERLEVRTFDWRIDCQTRPGRLPEALAGNGEWETVTVPHYGGPIGRATAFYRTTITLPQIEDRKRLWLHFEAVDYIAKVYLNGNFIGAHEGLFAPFEFDVTDEVLPDAENVLLVQVENDAICMGNNSWDSTDSGDKIYAATGPGWDDPHIGWHHCPPGMGIYRTVWFETRPERFIEDGWVRPLPAESAIELWLEVHATAVGNSELEAVIEIFGRNFEKEVLPRTEMVLKGVPGIGKNYYRLRLPLETDRLWCCETPWLHTLQVQVGEDAQELIFGMRSFYIEEQVEPKGRLFLNGNPIRLRGVNTMGHEQQCVMAGDFDQLLDDFLIYKMAGLNYIRFTQRPVEHEVYAVCDALGLMAQADLPLFQNLRRNQFNEAVRQSSEMERFTRRHPSVVMTSFFNEPFPPKWHNALHRHLSKEEVNAFFASASTAVLQENPDRVIKPVDGDYDPPSPGLPDNHCYTLWYNGHGIEFGKLEAGYWQAIKPGWCYACGEYGAEGLDPVDLMRRRYPAEWLPQRAGEEREWTPRRIRKAQSGDMYQLFYDRPATLEGWVEASQNFQAWTITAMTEAFRRDPRMVSFALHLGIDAFPSGWMKTIVDCERRPKKGFFTFRDALAPVLPSLRAPRRFWWTGESFEAELWISNDLPAEQTDLQLQAELRQGANRIAVLSEPLLPLPAWDAQGVGRITLPLPDTDTRTACTLLLQVCDKNGDLLGQSTYAFDVFARTGDLPDWKPRPELTEDMLEQVRAGKTVVCGPLPQGIYRFGDIEFEIAPINMGNLIFCSRATGHPLVEGFESNDFRLWFDNSTGYASPFADSVIAGLDWEPILLSGHGAGFGKQRTPAPVAAEKKIGNGRLIVCQLHLENRLAKNPPATIFARRLQEAAANIT